MAEGEGTGHLTTDELFRQHASFVARFLARLGVPAGQLEDALQEVFLVAHRNGGYRPGLAKPTSYLASIALRAAAKHRQREGRARVRHSDAPLDELPGEQVDPARALQTQQDLERLQLALQRLPEDLCTTLLLVEMEGESCVSVAAGLGCPVGTIYWRLHQARKELRAALKVVDAARRGPRAAYEERDARAQPARTWMMLFGLDTFSGSEASRLLQLARAQPAPMPAVEQLLARHRELIRAGAELPAWASGIAAHSASWLTVLGAGPLAAGAAAGSAIVAVALLSPRAPSEPMVQQPKPEPQPSVQLASQPPAPVERVAAVSPSAPAPSALAREQEPTAHEVAPRSARSEERSAQHTAQAREVARDRDFEQVLEAISSSPSGGVELAPSEPEADVDDEPAVAPEPAAKVPGPAAKPEANDPVAQRMGRAVSDAELAEMREIARVERLLSDEPARALALTRALAASFPESRFREERAYLEVMALGELQRASEMREKAAEFLRAYPAGLYSARVRKALAAEAR